MQWQVKTAYCEVCTVTELYGRTGELSTGLKIMGIYWQRGLDDGGAASPGLGVKCSSGAEGCRFFTFNVAF